MMRSPRLFHPLMQCSGLLLTLLVDIVHFLRLCLCSPAALAAENPFLRKQLALYQERCIRARRAPPAIRPAGRTRPSLPRRMPLAGAGQAPPHAVG